MGLGQITTHDALYAEGFEEDEHDDNDSYIDDGLETVRQLVGMKPSDQLLTRIIFSAGCRLCTATLGGRHSSHLLPFPRPILSTL